MGGSNDLASNNFSKSLWHIFQFIKQNTQTNIILATIPYHHDLSANTYVNDEIKKFNRKLSKHMKPKVHATTLEIDQDRKYFTKHGEHLNGQGKENICRQLASIIGENFQSSEVTPISLGWKKNQTVVMEARTIDTHNDSCENPKKAIYLSSVTDCSKNSLKDVDTSCSIRYPKSTRRKKPCARSDDFLWI
jgi:hypothetical protein